MNKVKFIEKFDELEEFIKDKKLITVQHIIKAHTYESDYAGVITEHEEMTMVVWEESK
jgi:hypothetical protein